MSVWPWFPMYATDFLNSRKVRRLSPEQVGVYILLLCHEWDGGAIPDDPAEWPSLTQGADPNIVRTVLERCFNLAPDGWVNDKLEDVREVQVGKRDKRVRAGRASGKARKGRDLPDLNTVQAALEQRSNNAELTEVDVKQSREETEAVAIATEGEPSKLEAIEEPTAAPTEATSPPHDVVPIGPTLPELHALVRQFHEGRDSPEARRSHSRLERDLWGKIPPVDIRDGILGIVKLRAAKLIPAWDIGFGLRQALRWPAFDGRQLWDAALDAERLGVGLTPPSTAKRAQPTRLSVEILTPPDRQGAA